jgi:hypothetical protein
MDVHNAFNLVSRLAFLMNYGLCLIIWISFSHLFIDFMHTHPHNIFLSFWTWGSHNHFVGVRYTIGDSLKGMLFALAHFYAFHSITITHLTCVFFSLADDTHIIGLASYVILVFLQLHHEFSTLGLLV